MRCCREAIVTNTLKPGTRLRADDLAGKLGVSKTPVREALRKLQAESLITVQAGNALTVKSISEEQLFEMYYTREALEGMAARLAAENAAAPSMLAKLRMPSSATRSKMPFAVAANLEAHCATLTGDFQLVVFRAARNDTIYRLLRHLQEQIRQFGGTTLTQPGGRKEGGGYSARALLARDRSAATPAAAEKLAREPIAVAAPWSCASKCSARSPVIRA